MVGCVDFMIVDFGEPDDVLGFSLLYLSNLLSFWILSHLHILQTTVGMHSVKIQIKKRDFVKMIFQEV